MPSSSSTLLRRASEGDLAALAELVTGKLGAIRSFIRKRTGPRFDGVDSIDDLVQSAAREALGHLEGFEFQGEAAFDGWLYQIALTKIIARYRYHRADRRCLPDAAGERVSLGDVCAVFASPSEEAIGKEFEERFRGAFERLDADQQQVFFLARVLDLPHREVAAQIGRSEDGSRSLLKRTVRRLGVLMGLDGSHGETSSN